MSGGVAVNDNSGAPESVIKHTEEFNKQSIIQQFLNKTLVCFSLFLFSYNYSSWNSLCYWIWFSE